MVKIMSNVLIVYIALGIAGQLLCLFVRDLRANASHLIWWLAFVPVWLISLPIIAIALLTPWEGKRFWFGNYLWGRGNNHPGHPTVGYWQEFTWLALRNPISNFGKFTLAVAYGTSWAWHRTWVGNRFQLQYGWAITELDLRVPYAKFVFRPGKKK